MISGNLILNRQWAYSNVKGLARITCLQKNASEDQMQQEEQKGSHLKDKYSMTIAEINKKRKFKREGAEGKEYSFYRQQFILQTANNQRFFLKGT